MEVGFVARESVQTVSYIFESHTLRTKLGNLCPALHNGLGFEFSVVGEGHTEMISEWFSTVSETYPPLRCQRTWAAHPAKTSYRVPESSHASDERKPTTGATKSGYSRVSRIQELRDHTNLEQVNHLPSDVSAPLCASIVALTEAK